jgi:hypothetical protein
MAIELIKYQMGMEVWRYLWRDRSRFLHIWRVTMLEHNELAKSKRSGFGDFG